MMTRRKLARQEHATMSKEANRPDTQQHKHPVLKEKRTPQKNELPLRLVVQSEKLSPNSMGRSQTTTLSMIGS
jgi:hypothetical protein